jgi:hypothetical protein
LEQQRFDEIYEVLQFHSHLEKWLGFLQSKSSVTTATILHDMIRADAPLHLIDLALVKLAELRRGECPTRAMDSETGQTALHIAVIQWQKRSFGNDRERARVLGRRAIAARLGGSCRCCRHLFQSSFDCYRRGKRGGKPRGTIPRTGPFLLLVGRHFCCGTIAPIFSLFNATETNRRLETAPNRRKR